MIFDESEIDQLENALTPKQKKVVNFLFGQCMKSDPNAKKADPRLLRKVIIERLVLLTLEDEEPSAI